VDEVAAEWPLWGGTARLVVRPSDPQAAAVLGRARAVVEDVVAEVDAAASRFRPDSEVSRLAVAGGDARPVSPLLGELVAVALDAAARTGGAVDPTLGSALVAAGYDRDLASMPTDRPDTVAPVLRRTAGWRDVELDRAAGTVRLPDGVLLDLGATAKAFAADLAAARAYDAVGCPVLVSLLGDLAVAGTVAGAPWRVRVVERPDDAGGPVVEVHDGGVATSTTRARRWAMAGRPMHHLIDPVTGLPVREVWRTVTVAAASCLEANTAATATVVKGAEGLPWLRATGLPARLVGADGEVAVVNGWPPDEPAKPRSRSG
jgi:FAD:protein FMN transferase